MTETRRPALRKLATDQRALVKDLQSGFRSRERVLLWLQKVSIRSLGNLPDAWFRSVAMRPDILDELVGDGDREQFRRGQLADLSLHRAFREAFHRVRERANEYTAAADGEHVETPDGTRQKFVAMRPEISALDDRQREALLAMFDGFADREAIRLWVADLRTATEGQLPASFLEYAAYSPMGYEPLVAPPDDGPARTARENMAATLLLPAMNRGVRVAFGDASEQPEEGNQTSHDSFET